MQNRLRCHPSFRRVNQLPETKKGAAYAGASLLLSLSEEGSMYVWHSPGHVKEFQFFGDIAKNTGNPVDGG